jgi:F-type H+-transporting ATPase subunit a
VDSVGYLHKSDHGYPTETVLGITTIVDPGEEEVHAEDAHAEDTHGEEAHADDAHAEDGHGEEGHGYALVPFVRVASTDLNFTLSLALISVVMTQVIGFQALGSEYLVKYWNGADVAKSWKEVRFGNPMEFIIGLMKWLASLLEIVAEIAKVLSFTFRLFGVIFAGSVLLFFVGSMLGGVGQSAVVLLELLFGPLQALVFGMLTMMFMSLATISHAHGDEEGHH